MSATAYPLQWPQAWPRTASGRRLRARFHRRERQSSSGGSSYTINRETTIERGSSLVLAELERMGARHVVISTNVELRRDGLPYSGRRAPEDPGVAVYFRLDGRDLCIPSDKWDRVADNLVAVAKTVEALRGIERWGARSMVEAAFAGFKALPENAGGVRWWEVLRVASSATRDEIQAAYKARAMETHPDAGGDVEEFQRVNEARRQGLAAAGGGA